MRFTHFTQKQTKLHDIAIISHTIFNKEKLKSTYESSR